MTDMMKMVAHSIVAIALFIIAGVAYGGENEAISVKIVGGTPQVESLTLDDALNTNSRGLVIWSEKGIDRWRISQGDSTQQPTGEGREFDPRLTSGSRNAAESAGPNSEFTTIPLDQIVGQVVVRGEGFLTPIHGGRHLNGNITIRRLPENGDPKFPQDGVAIYQGNRKLLDIPFDAGTAQLKWTEIPDLTKELRDGLPPGSYSIRFASGGNNTAFVVEDADTRDYILHRPNTLAELLGTSKHALYRLIVVEELLSATDDDGKPTPYFSDVLDLIESRPDGEQSDYFRELTTRIHSRLKGETPLSKVDHPTGIDAIDEARLKISRGQWNEATRLLEPLLKEGASARSSGLAQLYMGVIVSESAADDTTAVSAEEHFERAIQLSADAPVSDQFRAHNNYANFLLLRAQDRLYNSNFQAAAGVDNPLLRSLMQWRQARDLYETALQISDNLKANQKAAVQVNLARAHVLLADLLRVLCQTDAELTTLNHKSVVQKAKEYATLAGKNKPDSMTRGAAAEILAHLNYRDGDIDECRHQTLDALKAYYEIGFLAGVEGGYRMLGMCGLKQKPLGEPSKESTEPLNQFLVSQLLSELLRERIGSENSGISKAGFFARRAYVNEQIIELLIERGDALGALQFAELSKARSLQDVLMSANVQSLPTQSDDNKEIAEIIEDWPVGVVGLEYFLGSKNAWVFVIVDGKVEAIRLQHGDGTPVASQKLVAQVTQFLQGMNFTARQMLTQYQSEGKFDSSWQHELSQYFSTLIPASVRDHVANAKTLVVVPHHVLHYFPFAALVTETDSHEANGFEMVLPKFLIEQGMDIVYAPSFESWELLRDRGKSMKQVNAVGIVEFESAPPLPGVEKDLENLRLQFGDRLQTITKGEQASMSEVTKIMAEPGMLFAATHGMNVADRPMDSFLLCHADGKSDGHLTASDIFSSPVGADMVVMSACFSGLADRSPLPGDDLFGLQRAFLSSGASSVVSGLWDVYDGTGPLLMNQFFSEMNQGKFVATALANAQRSFISERRTKGRKEVWIHPYFWSVYTVAGSDTIRFAN